MNIDKFVMSLLQLSKVWAIHRILVLPWIKNDNSVSLFEIFLELFYNKFVSTLDPKSFNYKNELSLRISQLEVWTFHYPLVSLNIHVLFRSQICDVLKESTYSPGEYVIRQGDIGDRFYIIVSGKLVAERKNADSIKFI